MQSTDYCIVQKCGKSLANILMICETKTIQISTYLLADLLISQPFLPNAQKE